MSYRGPTCVSVEASTFINSCLKQGYLIGLSHASMIEAIKTLLIQNSPPSVSTPTFTHDKTKDGWTLVQNMTEPVGIYISKFKMVSFLKSGESYIKGEEMRRRAINMKCNFGQTTAEYFLAHQDEIPKEFRKYYLVFPGTVWQYPRGSHGVPCLVWNGYWWNLYFYWLGGGWCGIFYRLLSLCKSA